MDSTFDIRDHLFYLGNAHHNLGHYMNAIVNWNMVLKSDKNYDKAQEHIAATWCRIKAGEIELGDYVGDVYKITKK